jgi:hypothetical protein
MNYILDIDRTLFDSDRWRTEHGGEYTEALVTPTVWQHSDVAAYRYDDALPWLAAHSPEELHILTAMSPRLGPTAKSFQVAKLAHLGVADMVASLTFMEGDKGPHVAVLAASQPAVFVDDSLDHHQSVRIVAPQVTCCLMVRPGQPEPAMPLPPDIHLVRNLADVDAIVAAQ